MSVEKNKNQYHEIYVAELPSDMISSWNGKGSIENGSSCLYFSTELHLNSLFVDHDGQYTLNSTPIVQSKAPDLNIFCTSYSRLAIKESSASYMEAYIMEESSEWNDSSPNPISKSEELKLDDSLHQIKPIDNRDAYSSILIKKNVSYNGMASKMKESMQLKFRASCAELFETGLKKHNKVLAESATLLFVSDSSKIRAYNNSFKDGYQVQSSEPTEYSFDSDSHPWKECATTSMDELESSSPHLGNDFINRFIGNSDLTFGNPWHFSSPITLLHSCILQNGGTDPLNLLTASCEDGTIRIILFEAHISEASPNKWTMCLKGRSISEFVVDGPITSLSFAIDREKKFHDVKLLVGSIYGFGCIFEFDYSQKKFLGPFVIAGGFWNSMYNEEDAVTAVKYLKELQNGREILIGLFSGRMILLTQTYGFSDHDEFDIQQREQYLRSNYMFHVLLPYPVFSLQSMEPHHAFGCDIVVITRRTIHVYRSHIDKLVQDAREKVDILHHKLEREIHDSHLKSI